MTHARSFQRRGSGSAAVKMLRAVLLTPTLHAELLEPINMALGEAAEACLLALQAWLLALATTALACWKLAAVASTSLLGLPGVQLTYRLARVRSGRGRQPAGVLQTPAPRDQDAKCCAGRAVLFQGRRQSRRRPPPARSRSFPAACCAFVGAGISGPPSCCPGQPCSSRP